MQYECWYNTSETTAVTAVVHPTLSSSYDMYQVHHSTTAAFKESNAIMERLPDIAQHTLLAVAHFDGTLPLCVFSHEILLCKPDASIDGYHVDMTTSTPEVTLLDDASHY